VRYATPNTSHHEWQDIPAMPHPPHWTHDAACTTHYADLWYPGAGDHAYEAKTICGTCPVRIECLQYALDHTEKWGIWGGLTERERRRLTGGRHNRACRECGNPFTPHRPEHRYCTQKCGTVARARQQTQSQQRRKVSAA